MAKGKKAAKKTTKQTKKVQKKAAKIVKKEKKAVKKAVKKQNKIVKIAKKNPKRAEKKQARVTKRATKKAQGKTLGKKIKKAVTNPIDTLKNVAKSAKQGAEFVALLPFRVAMLAILKQRDVRVPRKASIKEIASLFYVNVIAKENLQQLEHADAQTGEEVAFEAAKDIAANAGIPGGQAAVGIVQAILNWFKARKKQKDNKQGDAEGSTEPIQELTTEEKEVVKDEEEVSPEEEKVLDAVDKKLDVLAKETGGEDSKGNIHAAPKDGSEDAGEDGEAVDKAVKDVKEGKQFGVMRLYARVK